MTVRRTSAAALLGLVGAAVLVGYIFRRQLLDLAVIGVCGRVGFHLVRSHLGIRPRAKTRKTWLEIGGAAVAGWLFAKRTNDAVAQAVRSGAELQIHVKPRSRYVSR